MKKGVILQERDFKILALAFEHTVMSFEMVKRIHFGAVNLQTASNRLNRLCRGGFLRKYRAGLVIYQGTQRQVQMVFTITLQGIQALKARSPGVVIRDEPVPINSHTLIHDLLLGEVVEALKPEYPGRRIVNTKLLGDGAVRGVQLPDAIIRSANGKEDLALELELTVKSEKRYREIVTNYRLAGRFARVLVVTSDDSVALKMARAAGVDPPDLTAWPVRFSKFQFRRLSEFLPCERSPEPNHENTFAA